MRRSVCKRLIPLLLSLLLTLSLLPAAAADSGYRDVPEGTWAAESIEKATAYGLMNGMGDGIFGYGSDIRRGEFITLLVRLFRWEMPEADGALFTDVSAADWFYSYVYF